MCGTSAPLTTVVGLDGAADGPAAPTRDRAPHQQDEHRPDDGADDAAEVELVIVPDPEDLREDEVADQRADDPEDHGLYEPHGVAAGQQQAAEVAGDDADDDCGDDFSKHALALPKAPVASCMRIRQSEEWDFPLTMSLDDPVIITCAISGAVANRDQCPAIPYTPDEYAAEARRAVDEGASMIHIHARTPDGVPSYEIEDFEAIVGAIQAAVDDVIINLSTGAIGVPLDKRIAYLRALKPDVAALNMGSMNYAKYSRRRGDFVFKA